MITVQIGNSDDKLTQREWAEFSDMVNNAIHESAKEVHFSGAAYPLSRWQNAAWCFIVTPEKTETLQKALRESAAYFDQESIAWTTGETIFLAAFGRPDWKKNRIVNCPVWEKKETIMNEQYFNAWAIVHDGEIATKDEIGIGVIYGYDFAAMNDLLTSGELYEAMCLDKIEIPNGAIAINFRGTNLYRESGQQTFPETGQWDFPPCWMFDLEITGFDYMPMRQTVSVLPLNENETVECPF
ncbi:MAG: hypothetical protein DDT21_02291 [Syntrophomonadaceae bacterium]|nr:hypothetical protein [Bacillota bacterium]